jgi:dipeptidyl aminopeptidase/acylaminoacyl peptidase
MSHPYTELADYVALPRLTGLALSTDGSRLVATVQRLDAKRSRYVSSLEEIPLRGGACTRLTRSEKGETAPAFLPDGSLLFVSERPEPDSDEDESALWLLPPVGEARVVARRAGGLGSPVVAKRSGAVVVSGSRLAFSTDADDAERRKIRKDRKISAILHSGMPIRHWDHELADEWPRLLHLARPGAAPTDLAPDATFELTQATYSISADGATVATTWRERRRSGRSPYTVAVIDVASGTRTPIAAEDGVQHSGAEISPDGLRIALQRQRDATFAAPPVVELIVVGRDGGSAIVAQLGDLHPTEWTWTADSQRLVVTGDWHGRGAVLLIDAATGELERRLASDAVYASLCPAPDGRHAYALRSTWTEPPAPVQLDLTASDQQPVRLPHPAEVPPVPGRLEEVSVEVDGATVTGWLCLPDADGPAPLMQWIHGGPFGSYNTWSWRWNPWLAVARGWAVLLPDPPLSTGYGYGWLERAWPYRAEVVWQDVEALLVAVVARPDIDGTRTALLGASFGGFMTNWIAGHSDRFGAIVTHAGLWALDQQHATTDAAHYKAGIFGTPADHPEWYAENSPHHSVDAIRTPMLVVHGNRDYRVPVSEALRLWWDLVSRWDGDPADVPHRFLQLTGENHWVLSPANAEIWQDVVLGFCAQHVLGEKWTPSPLL